MEKINPQLEPLVRPIEGLIPDPANARKHNEKNLKSIVYSLSEFGQQKPIVILTDGTVIAGNGTIQAMIRLGWKKVAAVTFEDREKAVAYAIADNRSAELAEWDNVTLFDNLQGIEGSVDLTGLGFDASDLELLDKINAEAASFSPAAADKGDRLDLRKKTVCPRCGHEF